MISTRICVLLLSIGLVFLGPRAARAVEIHVLGVGPIEAGRAGTDLWNASMYLTERRYDLAITYSGLATEKADQHGIKAIAHLARGCAYAGQGDAAKSQQEIETAFRLAPKSGMLYAAAGQFQFRLGTYSRAVQYFERGLTAAPNHDLILDNLARLRATCPDAAFRNGAEAVRMARLAYAKKSAATKERFLRTLAAAEAEAGDFDAAIKHQEELVNSLSPYRTLEERRKQLREDLEQYRNHRPRRHKPDTRKNLQWRDGMIIAALEH